MTLPNYQDFRKLWNRKRETIHLCSHVTKSKIRFVLHEDKTKYSIHKVDTDGISLIGGIHYTHDGDKISMHEAFRYAVKDFTQRMYVLDKPNKRVQQAGEYLLTS
jgi:hypothetical protein